MLHECHVTHVLWVIWDTEFDDNIHSKFDPRKGQYQVKLGQIRWNIQIQNFLTETSLSCPVLAQDSRNVIYCYVRQLEMPKMRLKMASPPLPVFGNCTAKNKAIAMKFCMHVRCMYLYNIYCSFWITWKFCIL